jgi:hypothetical protein
MFGALEDFIKEKANVFGPPPAITRQVVQRALALVVSPDINPLFFGLGEYFISYSFSFFFWY